MADAEISKGERQELSRLRHAEWRREWEAAATEALKNVPPGPAFKVWQSPKDGWWRVARREIKRYPESYDSLLPRSSLYRAPDAPEPKPSMNVMAWAAYVDFDPTHRTEAAARKWLKDYLSPPQPKEIGFDADGNEVAIPEPANTKAKILC
jgi:hypothetical protein